MRAEAAAGRVRVRLAGSAIFLDYFFLGFRSFTIVDVPPLS
jgi:hypothetical protein